MAATVLIVDDDLDMVETCQKIFGLAGREADVALSGTEALERLEQKRGIQVILADLRMPGMGGLELLKRIRSRWPEKDVVIMTGYGTIQNAVEAIKEGASDYITKPFNREELLRVVEKLLETRELREEVSRLRQELGVRFGFKEIVARSSAMIHVLDRALNASRNDSSLLITGETGTGKELLAKAIHYDGARSAGPFVPVNCSAIPHELLENELFGHRKGAFTGAYSDTPGLFRAAHGGTIFMDEIADMPIELQAKILRVLEDKRVRSLGETQETSVDVRVISATNRKLELALQEGILRQDLYYRLSVVQIDIPPLREHPEDIPILICHFTGKFAQQYPNTNIQFEPAALRSLTEYAWPGNVREVANLVESFHATGRRGTVTCSDLPSRILDCRHTARNGSISSWDVMEKEMIQKALQQAHGNKSQAAASLGISRSRLYKKIKLYGITL